MRRAAFLLALPLTGCGSLNELPTAPVVAISPAEPTDNDLLICEIVEESVDPDGDEVTYEFSWWVDGLELGVVDVEPAWVAAEQTLPGEVWRCVVTPLDYSEQGPTANASVTIGDTR